MKVRSLREMTKDELLHHKRDLLEEQFNLRMRRSLKALDNPLRLRQIRREIAKIMTVIGEDATGIRKLADKHASILAQAGKKQEPERK
ncbi:MAG TPA: 50S ribosomal protein L29 [Candidatus Deferrimicrobium sp.]|nr:50S ribosomal protein L29 [Candidatus Deferrimicrobium sp.]